MTGRSAVQALIVVVGLAAAVTSGVKAWEWYGPYDERLEVDPRTKRVYDSAGQLTQIISDMSGDLQFDTFTYFEGGHLARIDMDDDDDGKLDRRQRFALDGTVAETDYLGGDGAVRQTVQGNAPPLVGKFAEEKK